MGASNTLLNADHEEVYFKGMPLYKGKVSSFQNVHESCYWLIYSWLTCRVLSSCQQLSKNFAVYFRVSMPIKTDSGVHTVLHWSTGLLCEPGFIWVDQAFQTSELILSLSFDHRHCLIGLVHFPSFLLWTINILIFIVMGLDNGHPFCWTFYVHERCIFQELVIMISLCLQRLRRIGDIIKRTTRGYFIVQGRADDTMNLGGIKVP